MKKLVSLFLALILALGLSIPAMAEGTTLSVAAIETAYGSEIWQEVTAAFTELTGIQVDLVTDKNLEDTIEVCIGEPYVDSYDYTKLDIPKEYFAEQMQAFIDVINDCGDGLTANMEDGLRAQELIEKVYESSDTHSWVDVRRN